MLVDGIICGFFFDCLVGTKEISCLVDGLLDLVPFDFMLDNKLIPGFDPGESNSLPFMEV